MALETETLLLNKAIQAGMLSPEKGRAALTVYSQLLQMGAQFTFGQFLVEKGLLSSMALAALEDPSGREIQPVSQLGDFKLEALLGEGENGAVYRATQVTLQRPVAVKVLSADLVNDPQALARFQNEARATAKLSHPNVVQGIDIGYDQGLYYFAMELADGGSARALLESSGGKLDETVALRLVQQAALGLKAAHAVGLVHRDLKPDNILLSRDGEAKLVDLGISQHSAKGAAVRGPAGQAAAKVGRSGRPLVQAPAAGTAQPAGTAPPNNDGEFWASAPYAAPEIILGLYENNPLSDIYSLGATLFELLAGHPPFVGDSPEEVLQAHLSKPVPDLQAFRPDVSAQTAALLKRMLAKKPEERPPNAAAVVETLERILAARTTPVVHAKPATAVMHRPQAAQPARPPTARHGLPVLVPLTPLPARPAAHPSRPGIPGRPKGWRGHK